MVSEKSQIVTTANTTSFVVAFFGKDRRALPRTVWLRVCFDRVVSYIVRVDRSKNDESLVGWCSERKYLSWGECVGGRLKHQEIPVVD